MAEESKAVVSAGKTALQAQSVFHGSPIQLRSLDEYLKLGEVLWKSGYFGDVKSAAQAVAKMIAGAEMGFGPMASLSGVYIQGSKPSFMANLIAAAVKKNGYDYSVDVLTDTECKLTFYGKGGKLLGVSIFTMDDAKLAGLTAGSNAHSWRHYPRNMLFSRAMSNGARWYCPDIFGGVTPYTPDELDYVIDGETGEAIDAVVSPNGTQPPERQPVPPKPPAPEPVKTPEPETVSEMDEHFKTKKLTDTTVKFWDGKQWQEKPAYEYIHTATGGWFVSKFVGDDKAFAHQNALFGKPGTNNTGHLGKHYNRQNFVNPKDKKDALTWREFSELVAYAWWKQGDKEHGTLSLPRYQEKLVEDLKEQGAIPYDTVATVVKDELPNSVPTSYDVVSERAEKLGVDVKTLAQASFGAGVSPSERQLATLWQVLDAVELGNVKADDFDGQLEMIMLN